MITALSAKWHNFLLTPVYLYDILFINKREETTMATKTLQKNYTRYPEWKNVDQSEAQGLIERAAEANWNRKTNSKMTAGDVKELLDAGRSISLDTASTYILRFAPTQTEASKPETFICRGCGAECPISQRMNASLGQCCPNCYDDMSG